MTDYDKAEEGEYQAIRGVVARVLNSRTVVINRGEEHGVLAGDTFAVLRPEPEQIKDPETGVIIGEIELEKVRVRVTEVQPQLSIAQTFRKYSVGGNSGLGLSAFGPEREVVEEISLKNTTPPVVGKSVAIGDPVREIT